MQDRQIDPGSLGQPGPDPEQPLLRLQLPLRHVSLSHSVSSHQGHHTMPTSTAERAKQIANARLDTWQRMMPVLSSLHVSRSQGPEVLVDALHDAPLTCKAQAIPLLRVMAQRSWALQRLSGPYAHNHRLGFMVVAGPVSWWLTFEPGSHLHIAHLERVAPQR